jgi:amino acid transporter
MSEPNRVQGVAGLKKVDLKVHSIVFMIFCLVAAGAFGIEEMIPESGPGITLIMLIVFPFVWALPISNMVSEMGSVLPHEGGVYVWSKEALGEFWGFQAGWWNTVSIYVTNAIYVALVVGYLGKFVPMTEGQALMVKVGMVLVFTIINLLGLREVSWVSTALSIIVLVAFAAVAVVGFLNWNQNPFEPVVAEGLTPLEGIGGCIAICIWMYCGYECISTLAGEVKNPQRIPKALLIAMPLIALTYVLPTMAGLASVGEWDSWGTAGDEVVGYSDVFTQYLGPGFGVAFLVVAIIAQCSIFNTYLASGSRGFFVLSDDNLFPKALEKVSKNRGVPYVGVISIAAVTMFLVQFDFKTLVMTEVVFILALYLVMSVTTIVLRKKIPVEQREGLYVIKGGKFGLYFCTMLPIVISIIALLINGVDYLLAGLLGMASGPVVYVIFKRVYGGLTKKDPENNPINPNTKLAPRDLSRISLYSLLSGIFAFAGSFFMSWYEGDWGTEYYLEEYGEGFLSNFDGMISGLQAGGIVAIAFAVILYLISRRVDK